VGSDLKLVNSPTRKGHTAWKGISLTYDLKGSHCGKDISQTSDLKRSQCGKDSLTSSLKRSQCEEDIFLIEVSDLNLNHPNGTICKVCESALKECGCYGKQKKKKIVHIPTTEVVSRENIERPAQL
jgi:hypothetical protein